MVETLRKHDLRIFMAVFGLTSVLLMALFPICCAFASEGGGGSHNFDSSYPAFGKVWYDNKKIDEGANVSPVRIRYGVVAYTTWDAAMYCIKGKDLDSLTNRQKGKLVNTKDFYDFANLFKVGKPELTNDWAGDSAVVLAWNNARQMYGETYCYSCIYTLQQKLAAQEALNRILAESDTSGSVRPDMELHAYRWNNNNNDGLKIGNNKYFVNKEPFTPDTLNVVFSDNIKNYLSGSEFNGYDIIMELDGYDNILRMYAAKEGEYEIHKDTWEYSGGTNEVPTSIEFTTTKHYWTSGWDYYPNNCSIENGKAVYTVPSGNFSMSSGTSAGSFQFRNPTYVSESSSIISEPEPDPEPPPVWPTSPTTPKDPPTVPDPPTPTPPTPWSPIPDIDIEITGTDFQDLLDALNEHCIHLQNSIQSNISQLWDLQSDFFDTQFTDLKDYLNSLFEWLAERMNFNVSVTNSQYDDTSVVYWLKEIWSKMGEGINTQPADPVQDTDDWWAWLLALMTNFVGMLMGFGSDKLGDVTNALSTLTSKFPFSLPWDLAAIFALLDAPAQTPAFDLPCFAVSLEGGIQQVSAYHITLEAFDDVWENVRWIERIGFVVMLIRSTDLFMSMFRRAVNHD